jgi:hypothetical protein
MRWPFQKPRRPTVLVGHITGDPADLPEGVVYAPGRDPDEPPRVSKEAEVSDDPQLIAWTRGAYEADLDYRFSAAMDQVRSGERVDWELRAGLERRSPQAVRDLVLIMDDGEIAPGARVRAADMLTILGQPQGERFLIESLASPSAELCAAALEVLGDWFSKVDVSIPEVAGAILRLLASPHKEVAGKIAHLCQCRAVPGAEEALRSAVLRRQPPLEELAETLASLATTRASVEAALPHLFRGRQREYVYSANYQFRRVIQHPDPAVSEPFRVSSQRYLLTYGEKDRLGQHWAADIAVVADSTLIPLLEQIVEDAGDPVSRAYALEALARLEPGRAVDRVVAEIDECGSFGMLVSILREYATEPDAERIIEALTRDWQSKPEHRVTTEEARLLVEKLGEPGQALLTANSERLDPDARQWMAWRERGLNVEHALSELHAAGVIRQTPEELLSRAKAQRQEPRDPFDVADPTMLSWALNLTGLTTMFDTETGLVPCRHDYLIDDFAQGSSGEFKPECAIQVWVRESEDDYDSPYLVQFVYSGRLYRFGAENYGDYYDVEAVVEALNVALTRSGRQERYIGLYTGGQIAHFFFADPTAFAPIAEKYAIPLSADPSEAMRAGMAFEERVFETVDAGELPGCGTDP